MATIPQFLSPDGQLRTTFNFSTTLTSRFFTGVIGSDTTEVQVSIRGGSFTSDPDFVVFEGTSFTIPNPASFPEGLDFASGVNEIRVRAVDLSGSVSGSAVAYVTLLTEKDLGFIPTSPTNISIERLNSSVKISVEGIDSSNFQGIHFYASTSPGGGSLGYRPINVNLVRDFTTSAQETPLASLPVESSLITGPDGNHLVDPLFFRVVGTQRDSSGNVLQTDFDESLEVPENVFRIRTSLTVNRVEEINTYSFVHDRAADSTSIPATIPNGDFTALFETDPIYYVATAVFYDSVNNVEIESSFSPEVQGFPQNITVGLGSFPTVSKDRIDLNLSSAILRSQETLSIEPGSVTRDTIIDPASDEFSRIRFLVDFIHRSQSFPDLLRIDDPALSGVSVPVSQSQYKQRLKQALFLTQDNDVQELIDQAFEKAASRYGKSRLAGKRSRGEVVFYTTRRPDATISIPLGTIVSGGGRRYRTTEAAAITLDNIASFYSGVTGRYSVRASIEAEDAGANGDVIQGQIRTIVRGPTGLSVINESRTFGGKDLESNRDLAVRTQNAIASVDTGTEAGYRQTASEVSGAVEVEVISAGDPLMQRDFDGVVHRGGKVDVWVRGTQLNTVTDTFAFKFEIEQNVIFELIGDPSEYRFRAFSNAISATNPIIEMLDFSSYGYGLRNDSTSEYFDLTDVVVESFDVIKLSTSVPQPVLSLTDVVRGDVRYRVSEEYVFPRQPVTQINSLTGSVTGVVSSTAYQLKSIADPLQLGLSTKAGDALQVIDAQNSSLIIPSGQPLASGDETHVVIGQTVEYLDNLGINPLTVRVFNAEKTVEYVGPFDPSGDNDYTILDGDETTPLAIVRTDTGDILSGQSLVVNYFYDENFTVSYTTNFLITSVQEAIESQRHLTADAVVKESIINDVELSATIVLRKGFSPSRARTNINTNLTNTIRALGNNSPLRPGDVVGVIENTEGVSYVLLPLTKMILAEGSLIMREPLVSDQAQDVTFVSSWSTNSADVYLLEDSLVHATTNGGGSEYAFRGVYQNDVSLELQIVQPETIGGSPGRAYIIGSSGLSIPGISDDATLISQGYTTPLAIFNQRLALTANRILISISVGDTPVNYDYTCTYFVGVDSGVKSIEPGRTTSLSLGNRDFTFEEDRY